MQFTNIPDWAIPKKADRYTFYETMALLGLENQWVRLSAAMQRALLGTNVFGKQQFMVDDLGVVTVSRSSCFGMDCEIAQYDAIRVRAAVEQNKKLSPGVFGPGYL
jgi:hypothetical protein